MSRATSQLQELKGIGDVLAERFVTAGYDTFAKIATAKEEDLKKIAGLNPRHVAGIMVQAADLAREAETGRAKRIEELKRQAAKLKERVQDIALSVRDRFKDEIAGKQGKKLEKQIVKVIGSLEKVEQTLQTKVKKSERGLVKAERRLEGLSEAGLKKVGKCLGKARKSLKKVYA